MPLILHLMFFPSRFARGSTGTANKMKWKFSNLRPSFLTMLISVIVVSAWFVHQETKKNHLNRTLITAVKRGNAIGVRKALVDGADPSAHDNHDSSVAQIVSSWLARLRGTKSPANMGPSALFLAVSAEPNRRDVIELLLKYGADPNAQGDYFVRQTNVRNLILYSAQEGEEETIQALAIAGADVNVRDDYGYTPLSLICYYANAQTVRILLDRGANPNIKGKRGETPLPMAVDGWNPTVVRLLTEHGANRNIATRWSSSADVLKDRTDKLLILAYHPPP